MRLLSLDGGGVRGVAELEILRRLETEIGLNVPITDFFDLIVGTSIGKQQIVLISLRLIMRT